MKYRLKQSRKDALVAVGMGAIWTLIGFGLFYLYTVEVGHPLF